MAQAPIGTPPPRPQVAAPPQDIVWDDEQPGRTAGPTTAGVVWDPQPGQLFAGPPPTTNLPKLPEKGPPSLLFDKVLPAAMEIGGAVLGAKGATTAVRGAGTAARYISGAFGAGVGGAVAGGAQDVTNDVASSRPPDPREVVGKFGERFTSNAVGEGVVAPALATVGRGIKALRIPVSAKGMARKVQRTAVPGAMDAARFVEGNVLPGQISDSHFVQLIDNLAGATFGRGRYQSVIAAQEQKFAALADAEIAKFGDKSTRGEAGVALRSGLVREAEQAGAARVDTVSRHGAELRATAEADMSAGERALSRVTERFGEAAGPEAVGKGSQRLIQAAHESADRFQNEVYNDLWARSASLEPDLSPLLSRAQALSSEAGAIGRATGVQGSASRAVGALKEGAKEAAETSSVDPWSVPGYSEAMDAAQALDPYNPRRMALIEEANQHARMYAQQGGKLTFQQVHGLRSFYGRMSEATHGNARGTFKQLHKAATQVLESLPGALKGQWQAGDMLHREMKERFVDGALAKVMKAHPATALKDLIGKNGAIDDVTLARETLGEEGWQQVQAATWKDMTHHPSGVQKTEEEILRELNGWSTAELDAVFDQGAGPGMREWLEPTLARSAAARPVPGQVTEQVNSAILRGERGIARAQRQEPFRLVSKLIDAADAPRVEKLHTLVGEEGWQKITSNKLQRFFGREGDVVDGVVTGKQAAGRLAKENEKLIALYGEDTANFLHQWTRHRITLERKNPLGSAGTMALQMATPSAVAGVFSMKGAAFKTAGAVILAPYTMSRIATSPKMQRTLIGAMTATEKGETGTAARLTAQLLGYLVREKVLNPDGSERREDAVGGVQGAEGGPGALGAAPPTPTGRGPGPHGAGAGPPVDPNGPPTPPRR